MPLDGRLERLDVDRAVLRTVGVDEGDGRLEVRGEDDAAVVAERAGEDGAAIGDGQQRPRPRPRRRRRTPASVVTRMAGESGPCSAWVMRSRRHDPRIGRRCGQDEALRRAGRQVDADLAADLDLGGRDPGVARPDDPVDGLDAGVGQAVGQGADGLGAAGDDEGVDAEQARRTEEDRVDRGRRDRPGVATMTRVTPATRAGTTVMTSELGYGADPPGT